jgi:predicted SnoaL-like aldol condensation-catalyzing enzyme
LLLFLISCGENNDQEKTINQSKANKSLVVSFYEKVLIQRDSSAINKYIGDVYIQHNPYLSNGKKH